MSIKKVLTKNMKEMWEVSLRTGGRGTKRLRRRFEKRAEAVKFELSLREDVKSIKASGQAENLLEELSFSEEADYWLTLNESRMSPGYKLRVKGILKVQLEEFGHVKLAKITPEFVSRYQIRERDKGSSPSTINRQTEVISAILNFSVRNRRIPHNPSKGFRKLKKELGEMKFLDQDEAKSFLDFANKKYPPDSKERWIFVVYLLAINTGLRAGEIWGLQRQDLVQNGELLSVQRQWNRITKDYTRTKGKDSRYVPVNDYLLSEIRSILANHKEIRADAPIFWGRRGLPKNHDTFRNQKFDVDIREWGRKIIRFHDLRHTAATLMFAANLDPKTVKEICGHKDIMTTMNYVHLLGGRVKEVAKIYSVTPYEDTKPLRIVSINES